VAKKNRERRPRTPLTPFVARPFEGLPSECDWVAMREVVPAARATARLAADGREIGIVTVLPGSAPALHRTDGAVLVALQGSTSSGDVAAGVAAALEAALATEPGTPVLMTGLPGPGARLQDLLDLDAPFEVTVEDSYDFWLPESEPRTPDLAAALAEADETILPTQKLAGVEAAYRCEIGERTFLRWVMPHPEQELTDAVARLHAAGESSLGGDSKYLGSFRALGVLAPVWEIDRETTAADLEAPTAAFAERLTAALAVDAPLTDAERRARAGVVSRLLTLS
jgi:hypothetical protein